MYRASFDASPQGVSKAKDWSEGQRTHGSGRGQHRDSCLVCHGAAEDGRGYAGAHRDTRE